MSAKVAVVIFKPGYNGRTDYAGVKWLSGFGESGEPKTQSDGLMPSQVNSWNLKIDGSWFRLMESLSRGE